MLNRKIVPLLYVALFLMQVELYSGKSSLYQTLVIGIVGIQIEAQLFSSKVVLGGRKTLKIFAHLRKINPVLLDFVKRGGW